MKKTVLLAAAGLALAAGAVSAQPPADAHKIVKPAELVWGPAPPIFNPGAQVTVVSGDLAAAGPFVVRVKMPAGYKIMPHFHPTDEHVTVLTGTVGMGMGDTLAAKAATDLGPGGYALMPAQMHHWLVTRTAATVQVHGMGPFALTYVNPADAPKPPPAK